MKRFSLFYLLVAIFLYLPVCTGCSEEEKEHLETVYASDVLQILSVDTEDTTNNRLPTRSIATTVQTEGKQLGIYAVRSDLSLYKPMDGANPATYTYTSGSWGITDASQQLRLPKSGSLSVYAWHAAEEHLTPVYQNGGNSYLTGIHILSKDDFAATGQTDYLYPAAPATVNVSSRKATFTLKHALAKLTFKVYKASSLTDEMFLTGIEIRDHATTLQTGTDKTMLLKDGTLQGLNGVSTITLTATDEQKTKILQKTEETGGKTTASPFCLLAPAGGVEYLSFYLTTLTGGQEQTFLTQQTNFAANRWTAGKHLVITIILDGMAATITGIKVYQWGDYADTYLPIS